MKALTHNIRQEREDQRDRSAQLFMWCIVVSMHQDDGIGASRLLRACNEIPTRLRPSARMLPPPLPSLAMRWMSRSMFPLLRATL